MSDHTLACSPGARRLDIKDLACERLFDEVPCCISIQDPDLRIVEANRNMIDEFGTRLGEPCYTVYKGRNEPCPECAVARTFEDGREHTAQETIFDRRGLPREVIVNTKPLRDNSGRIVAVMELFTDITVNRELEKRLHDSLRRFHTLFEQVPCFISVQDRDLRIVDSNGLFKEHFGQNLGGYCYKVYKRRDEPCEQCPVAKTFEDGLVHTSEEIIIDSTGSEVVVLVSSSPIRDSQGRVTEVMEVLTDITEIRLLQDKLASLGQLVGGIAHSIKNVLEGLRGGIYVANLGFRDNSREDIETGWEMVQRNVERISGMILDMLYCAKDRAPRRLPVSLPEMAEDVAELFRARAGQRDLDIETDIDPSMDTILADPKDIHSLLANLITNAMDACASDEDEAKKHFVHIGVSQDGDEAVIRVRDNGIGMDDDTRRKLFRMFFSTKGAFGTGLGLLVCHKVASEHGGAITVDSAPGQGSTFSVRLPVDPDSDAPDADG
jgi:PAS domain S-box-containing protein